MKPETRAALELYRDVEPTNVIVFLGLGQLKAWLADPTAVPKAIAISRFKKLGS